ncbi:PIG-L deacetylase family protein [Streptomyces griseus]|uniref:GlcNAc-PI de-N-acetylase n=1 Tax=Streptomyces sp. CMC78 TaxID=3231512 RepID=A0AB33KG87_9ACTN|nr:hypothetical protein OH733_11685 [Streptomyces griseus]WTD70006.1 hypothetical protein OH763_25300 [Streptomyces griseus]
MSSHILVVSPHLDDAVLSAAAQLCRGDDEQVRVVTVCAGVPAADAPPGLWDVITRAASAAARVEERLREDDGAMSHFACSTERLGELDGQHRGEPLDITAVAEQLIPFLADASEVWLPSGIGGHLDHRSVRDAGLLAREKSAGGEVPAHLYADVPYSIPYGWGNVAPDRETAGSVDVEAWRQWQLGRCGASDLPLGEPRWHELDEASGERKLRALNEYATQTEVLSLDRILRCDPDSLLRYELSWPLRP